MGVSRRYPRQAANYSLLIVRRDNLYPDFCVPEELYAFSNLQICDWSIVSMIYEVGNPFYDSNLNLIFCSVSGYSATVYAYIGERLYLSERELFN